MSQEKPLTEKSPTLFIPKDAFGETKPKNKYCTKSIVSKVLAILLFALLVTLVVECLFPVIERRYHTNVIDVIEVYDEGPVDVKITPDSVDPKNPVLEEPWHLDFLINPTRLCDTLESPETQAYARDPEVKLLMLVPSATDNFAQRDAIRKTWGSLATKSHGPIRLGFVLGSTPNATETSRIGEESERFGDIIQADFPDSNRTAKSVLMLKWISRHCPHAQYFLKANDDTFVNLDVLQAVTRKDPFASGGRFIGGFIHRGVQPSREVGEPLFVSELDYPAAAFPPYVSGSSYLTTGPTASRLFEASKGVKPLLPMEDVYVTGLCAEEIEANLVHEPCFRDEDIAHHSSWDTLNSLATVHSVSPEDMDKLWNDMTKAIYDAIHFPDEGFLGQPEDNFENIKPLFDLGSLFDWADTSLEDPESSSSDQSVGFESGFDPIAELIDDFFDFSKDQADSTDSSSVVPSDGLLDMNSLLRNLLVNNMFSFDGKNSNPLDFGSNPNPHIIIGSIRSRFLPPNFGDKNDDVSDLRLSPIQRIFMNFGRSGLMTPSLNNDAVDSRSSQSRQVMSSNSQSSFMSPSVEYNSRDPLNIRKNVNVMSHSSYLAPSFDTNNMNIKQIPNQNIMSSNIQSSFRAPSLDRVLNSQGVQQSRQNLPDWPGSQKALEQQQTTRFNLPMRWQKTLIIPLPLDQAGGRGMNLTEYFPQ